MEGYGDDGLDPLFPPSIPHVPASFEMQSQSESSYPSLDRVPRVGLQALDLNSQAEDFPNLAAYSDILGGRSGRTLGLRPPRHGAVLGRGQEVSAVLGRGQEVFADLGRGRGRGLGRGQPMPAASGARRRRTPAMVAAVAADAAAAAVGEAVGGVGGSRSAAGRGAGGGRGGRPRSQVSGRGGGSRRARTPISQPDHSINVEDDDEEDEGMDDGGQLRFSKMRRDKANWTEENTQLFCELWVQQIDVGNCFNSTMTTRGYTELSEKFYICTGLRHDKDQLRNRKDQLKALYQFWCRLQKDTGLGRNPDGSVAASENWWKTNTKEDDVDASSEGSCDGFSSEDEMGKMIVVRRQKRQRQFLTFLSLFGTYHDTYMVKGPRRTAVESGLDWVQNTLENRTQCYNMFRMNRTLFEQLHTILVDKYGLMSTSKMTSVEALALFLWIIGAPQSVRQAQNRFVRSLETVHRKFDEVLNCVDKLAQDIVKPVDPTFSTIHKRLKGPRFAPYFNDCIGAIDGTHVPVVVPTNKVVQHTGRHGYTSQNVLAICDFDTRFTFVCVGWPGSAHDMRVFNDAVAKYADKFPHPPQGKFYLVDSGYPNRLSPYKGTKYHIPEFRDGPMPKGMKETFNYAHSSLRNVIERAFGVLKMKWRILLDLPSYPMRKQSKIITACMAIHNFIRQSALPDIDFDLCDSHENLVPMARASRSENVEGDEDVNMNAFRDQLANGLFNRS